MLDDLFSNLEEQQETLRKKLAEVIVQAEAGDGAVKVKSNAIGEIQNISINPEKIDPTDTEQLEDLLLVAVNRALDLAAEKEAAASQELLDEMLPPGLGNFSDLIG